MGQSISIAQYTRERHQMDFQQLPEGIEPLLIPMKNNVEPWLYRNVVKCLSHYINEGRKERTLENVNHQLATVDSNITRLKESDQGLTTRVDELENLVERVEDLKQEKGRVRRLIATVKSIVRRWVPLYWMRPRWGPDNDQEESILSITTAYREVVERPNQQEQEGENNP